MQNPKMTQDNLGEQAPLLSSENELAADTETTPPHDEPDQVPTKAEQQSRPKSTNIIAAVSIIPLLAPTVWLWRLEQTLDPQKQTSSKALILTYLLSGTLGMLAVSTLQMAIALPTAWLCFGSDATKYLKEGARYERDLKEEDHRIRKQMSSRWQYYAFVFVFALVMAGIVEEGMKYLAISAAQKWGGVVHPYDCVTVGIAAGAGFATVESLAFMYATWKKKESDLMFILTIAERVVFGVPGHSMMAALTGVGVMARDFENEPLAVWQILALPVLFHAAFDFMLLAISAYNGHIGWVHPKKGFSLYLAFVLAVLDWVLLAIVLWHQLEHYGLI